jgi:hypothetical protein
MNPTKQTHFQINLSEADLDNLDAALQEWGNNRVPTEEDLTEMLSGITKVLESAPDAVKGMFTENGGEEGIRKHLEEQTRARWQRVRVESQRKNTASVILRGKLAQIKANPQEFSVEEAA